MDDNQVAKESIPRPRTVYRVTSGASGVTTPHGDYSSRTIAMGKANRLLRDGFCRWVRVERTTIVR